MSKWIDFSLDERKAMIQGVVEARQIDEAAAEKDWWVTAVLYALFHTSVSEYLLFKGGTSLSKGWDIINRFSEDIDLALNRDYFLNVKQLSCASCTSNTQIHNLREKGQDFLLGEFKDELTAKLSEMGLEITVLTDNDITNENGEPQKVPHDKDPSVLYVQYPSLYDSQAAYAIPTVKVEISVLSMSEPYEMRRISSLIEQTYKDEDVDSDLVQTIRTVSPARTFLEKAFLLCEEYQKDKPRTHRMTRHFYDLEKLMQTPYAAKALDDITLYHEIVEHRRKFYHVGYVDYDKEIPANIQIVPSDELMSAYEADYNEMKESFIYGQSLTAFISENKFSDGVTCPYCGKKHVRRNGHRKDGTQKFMYADCGKSFTARTNTITAGSSKSLETWQKYIGCMVNKLPIRQSAAECGMAASTSFVWRHKILDALRNMSEGVTLSGIAESDDTYFALSYKGNHQKSLDFDLGRAPRKRGGDGISKGLSDDLVCVPCAVDRKGHSIAEVSNLGECSAKDIDNVLGSRVESGSVFCTDGSTAQKKYAKDHGLDCVQIKGGKSKKGIYHIQHINNFHSTLKKFIANFNGVAKKYLNNYLAWNNLVNYSKKTIDEQKSILLSFTLTTGKRVTYDMIPARPSVPFPAAHGKNQSLKLT